MRVKAIVHSYDREGANICHIAISERSWDALASLVNDTRRHCVCVFRYAGRWIAAYYGDAATCDKHLCEDLELVFHEPVSTFISKPLKTWPPFETE
jgi:hypothetical protein